MIIFGPFAYYTSHTYAAGTIRATKYHMAIAAGGRMYAYVSFVTRIMRSTYIYMYNVRNYDFYRLLKRHRAAHTTKCPATATHHTTACAE